MTVTYECDVISSFCPMTSPILIPMQTSYNNIHMIKGMELYSWRIEVNLTLAFVANPISLNPPNLFTYSTGKWQCPVR